MPELEEQQLFTTNNTLTQKYQIIELTGNADAGLIYKARHIESNKIVAIKTLFSVNLLKEESKTRFQQKAYIAASLHHPNIVPLYDFGVLENKMLYLVIECSEEQTLSDILKKQKRLDFQAAMPIFKQICQALEYAHSAGIIHRDLKPSNIILTQDFEGKELIKVANFSVAPFIGMRANQKTTFQSGQVFADPTYMSPEQCQGLKLDHRSDIYSLGCVMYETLCRVPPLAGSNYLETLYLQVQQYPTPISELVNVTPLPDYLEAIVVKCLEKEPEERFQSAGQLLKELDSFCQQNSNSQDSNDVLPDLDQPIWLRLTGRFGMLLKQLFLDPPAMEEQRRDFTGVSHANIKHKYKL